MTNIPTLETQRLILRPHHLDDFEAHATLWANEDVVRLISGAPSTREQSWARMLRIAGMWHHMGFGFLAIEEKASRRFVGEAGFLEARREMEPSIEGTMEVGWALMPASQGRGYATEALTALIGWAEARFPGKAMSCIISPENAASLRVAAKLGFRETARARYNGEVIQFSR
ncbi:GNAT family N-acetyltransferase [Rhizobium sp. MC63]|uniref:RimJ/RimL family protein N-acetyltransferase n=2 Tax=Rhizobium TaxID=379 RepID=A0A7W8XE60_9HYPH|nr:MULTISPECIES: GNAT family N-acetyltransferase [Rhizobium]MBB4573748.1 RimJ/RimL family protein N-acetyltransferase [Rhizobium lentis]MBB5549676.1 RimJ/RimL family protein N-acetyltransferase [Rhizobium lentis]MBB5560316.1 RimJ/RimL family protein N-acetyltransferase [Rhizobium lentis]MBB5566796.1 RimJ/RimL family protein N-acetyltransferase [Rhizobium lentis]MDF0699054.1 GNAT family N-acetyltransferase [Rhizobium sp. MC63]